MESAVSTDRLMSFRIGSNITAQPPCRCIKASFEGRETRQEFWEGS
ncbi:hypothetical protein RSSM_03951 [Rhodopirellula sallentina SM41]|uniref:Uncharacterized protein n=1 Tax=Rhodopirellula sallentina SM41 TaxID=1263870 RepID=M5TZF5_9BACT|nr:hypothetical protein RSSM_03951 [Rhodopirellula sallentina SM41]